MSKITYIQCSFCINRATITYVTDWNEEIDTCENHKPLAKHLADGGDF